MPVLHTTEGRTLFAYYTNWQDDVVQVAEFVDCLNVSFGFPNDEALAGHPLHEVGLHPYNVHVVEGSAWIEELQRIEHVGFPNADIVRGHKHFVFVFHDTTMEAIARDLIPIELCATMADAFALMTELTLVQGY
jgi:hypothetical protein